MTRGYFGALRLAAARPHLHFTTRVFGHSAISPFLGGVVTREIQFQLVPKPASSLKLASS